MAVIGAGVVGCAVSLELARRGVSVALVEAEPEPGLAASGTNSGVLHTGFDSTPGELETVLILRSAALRDELLDGLSIPVLRCGAMMQAGPRASDVVARARANGVSVREPEPGIVEVPGEAVTDPVAYTLALAAEAVRHGARLLTRQRVVAIDPPLTLRTESEAAIGARVILNCAGLYADAVARLAGDDSFEIYPRRGEFLVFEPPGGTALERILLPVPTERTKGVLVFPTIDGKVVAGPTAVDAEDKRDWSVGPGAAEEILSKAAAIYPPIENAEPVAAYAGLRPAGRGVNYLIGPSRAAPGLLNVAAIRSTGLTASLGIAEHVAGIVSAHGVELEQRRPLIGGELPRRDAPWWRRTAEFRGAAG